MTDPQPLDILYVAPIRQGETCLQRLHVLRELGHRVVDLNSKPEEVARAETRFWRRVRRRLLGPHDWAGVNAQILQSARQQRFDVLWIDKGLVIEADTLRQFRAAQPDCAIVGYTLDDMARPDCTSRQFREHLPLYDLFFTNKSYAVPELTAQGARSVLFVNNAFDRDTHRPIPLDPGDRDRLGGPVGFIGDFEDDRARSMSRLAEAGIQVRIWGPNWHKLRSRPTLLKVEGHPLLGADYARAICAFDINLGFLRKIARDLQTTRSVEIPACGAFMLAERTEEHLRLFEEGKEAEFFATDEELIRKVRYYLEHPEERARIARAGRDRCLTGKYSSHDRLSDMLARVRALPRNTR